MWVVTRQQYGISALVTQTSFCEGSSGNLARRPLFSQATIILTSDYYCGMMVKKGQKCLLPCFLLYRWGTGDFDKFVPAAISLPWPVPGFSSMIFPSSFIYSNKTAQEICTSTSFLLLLLYLGKLTLSSQSFKPTQRDYTVVWVFTADFPAMNRPWFFKHDSPVDSPIIMECWREFADLLGFLGMFILWEVSIFSVNSFYAHYCGYFVTHAHESWFAHTKIWWRICAWNDLTEEIRTWNNELDVPVEVSSFSYPQVSPLTLSMMASQKASGAAQERGSLGTDPRLLNLLLGVLWVNWEKWNELR